MTCYLLDANVFIEAKNRHYGFDFCPAFWDWLVAQNQARIVASIEKVSDELLAGDDDLVEWVKERGKKFFLPPDGAVVKVLQTVSEWTKQNGYEPAAVNSFLQKGDYWLIAHGLAYGSTVVTHEVASNSRNKIKIPNVCDSLNLRCISPYAMLRQEHARFVLPE